MAIDDKIRDEKLQYDTNREAAKISALLLGKIDKYDYLTGEAILPSNQRRIALEKQTEKQVGALKSLNSSNKKDVLKQVEGIFSQNLMNDLIRVKLKEVINLQDIIRTDELNYKSKRRKVYNFTEYFLLIVFLRDLNEGYLSLKDADDEQSNFPAKIKNLDKVKKTIEKEFFEIT